MSFKVFRSIDKEIRENLTIKELWKGEDRGLITCWEVGREKSTRNPELADKAKKGELPILGWKGGIANNIKLKKKFGSYQYLAQWQGLRGEDLSIDFDIKNIITCSKTGVEVEFTNDIKSINKT